jgi:hypothetical protein
VRLAPRYAHCQIFISIYSIVFMLSKLEIELTAPSKTGTVAKMASTKNTLMIIGPLLGSALKIWLISSSFPYLSGFSYCGSGTLGSVLMSRLKTWLLKAWEDPKDARSSVARRGWEERMS